MGIVSNQFYGLKQVWLDHGSQGAMLWFRYKYLLIRGALKREQASCPVCGWQGRSFRPFLVMPHYVRDNAECPGCGSLERHRDLYTFYKSYFKDKKGVVVHYAAENALYDLFTAFQNIEYYPVYFLKESMPNSGPNVTGERYNRALAKRFNIEKPLQGDLQDSKLPDSSVDYVLLHHVLEHVPNEKKALQELFRITKPGGAAFINVPQNQSEVTVNKTSADEYGHWRDYGRDTENHLRSISSFKVEALKATSDQEAGQSTPKGTTLFKLIKPA